jgi:hypothetical protein
MCTACGDVLTRHWQGHLHACWFGWTRPLRPAGFGWTRPLRPAGFGWTLPKKRRQGMVLPTQGAAVEGLPTCRVDVCAASSRVTTCGKGGYGPSSLPTEPLISAGSGNLPSGMILSTSCGRAPASWVVASSCETPASSATLAAVSQPTACPPVNDHACGARSQCQSSRGPFRVARTQSQATSSPRRGPLMPAYTPDMARPIRSAPCMQPAQER